jgi:hypothetical protein
MTSAGTIVCSACGYDLSGSPVDGACAECGESVAESRRKHFANRLGEAMVMHFSVGLLGIAAACWTIALLIFVCAIAWSPQLLHSCAVGASFVVGLAAGLAAPIHLSARRVCEPFGGFAWPRRNLRLATIATVVVLPLSIQGWNLVSFIPPSIAVAMRTAVVAWFLVALARFLTSLSDNLGVTPSLHRPVVSTTLVAGLLGLSSTVATEFGQHPPVAMVLEVLASIAAAVVALLVAAWSYRLLRPLRKIMQAAAALTS